MLELKKPIYSNGYQLLPCSRLLDPDGNVKQVAPLTRKTLPVLKNGRALHFSQIENITSAQHRCYVAYPYEIRSWVIMSGGGRESGEVVWQDGWLGYYLADIGFLELFKVTIDDLIKTI